MRINLPNQITIARLLLSIVFMAVLAQYEVVDTRSCMLDWCAVIFVVAALTDWLDGYLARRSNQVTALGRVLQPSRMPGGYSPVGPSCLYAVAAENASLPYEAIESTARVI